MKINTRYIVPFQMLRRYQSSSSTKPCEEPVIVVPGHDNISVIGPPDPVSNLRPVIRRPHRNETTLQQQLREMQDSTQTWNQEFWTRHNKSFVKERDAYIARKHAQLGDKRQLTADEMSEFYKDFLDRNWSLHYTYNFQWYRRNFDILRLGIRVYFERCFNKFKSS